jgi:hypothetical protein
MKEHQRVGCSIRGVVELTYHIFRQVCELMAIDLNEINLTPEQRRYIAERAERTGKPWRDILNGLVPAAPLAGADTGESAYDMAVRLGLIAMSDEGPSDLATNPKYMEGFGEGDNGTSAR